MCGSTFLDETGRPSFTLLQHYASGDAPIVFFVFDVMMLRGRDLTGQPLVARRELLEQKILPALRDPVRYAAPLDAPLSSLIHAIKTQRFEGLVARRRDCRYEAGLRTGA
jgi:bifunctional non-homologous end joining protein LigD